MKISVITVAFNAAHTIGDTLASIAGQTHTDIEHIVVDGASTDGTLDVIDRYRDKLAKVVSDPDNGIYDAMNKGIALAGGDVIGFLNADDFYASKYVLSAVAEALADPDVDACYGDLCYVRQSDTSAVVRYWKSADFRPGLFSGGWCPPHPTFFASREIYEQFGGFDLSYKIAADFELMLRFLEVHRVRIKYIPKVLVKMRMGGTTNRSLSNIVKQNNEILEALKAHGLRSSMAIFFGKKLVSRGKQFFMRLGQRSE